MNLHLYSIWRFCGICRNWKSIESFSIGSLIWTSQKVYICRHCRVPWMHFQATAALRRFAAQVFVPALPFSAMNFGGEKEFMHYYVRIYCNHKARYWTEVDFKAPRDAHILAEKRRYSFRVSNHTKMNIKMPSLVCARFLESSSSLPAIFFLLSVSISLACLCLDFAAKAATIFPIAAHPFNDLAFFPRCNIFAFFIVIRLPSHERAYRVLTEIYLFNKFSLTNFPQYFRFFNFTSFRFYFSVRIFRNEYIRWFWIFLFIICHIRRS